MFGNISAGFHEGISIANRRIRINSVNYSFIDDSTAWEMAWPCRKTSTYTQYIKNGTKAKTSMPGMRFEPMIRVFEREKTFHAPHRTATVIGSSNYFTTTNHAEWGSDALSSTSGRPTKHCDACPHD
jgi:hypothetical protein